MIVFLIIFPNCLICKFLSIPPLFLSRAHQRLTPMVTGHQIRMNRILRNGKMLCIPMDHGISSGPLKGIEDPYALIYNCQHFGLTSVIINKGILKNLPRPTKIGLIVHFSGSTSLSVSPNRKMLTGSVEEALRLGADGVSLHINIGGKEEPEMIEQLGRIADDCHKWSMPLLAMMYPRGENVKNPHDPEIVGHVARIGAECGADIVKTLYTGDVDSFKKIVKSTPVPVVIAGGPKAKTDNDILQMTEEAMEAGAKGVTYGRNIFEHKDPGKMTHALSAIIFRKETAKEAAKYIEQK
ncbi:2-amino-3,7-dideoxy-D-threo-hept-6-ulosonate synthase [Candidatus Nitrosotalea okcheonensis]|uniref:2-amino-3,7-dideoxy-D-threo-hept-6-ulosonate synthase n=2 Tax=Candidatus Nitrosotalea okcheonensis TaxID=1903276 RepID=A0A2H1FC46_9ARCH|nr:2-amino-3,7-dideoxy-D-threo-hept-6-ulosonate synthase [Candidatus Nitrosotalea okcheonensis]